MGPFNKEVELTVPPQKQNKTIKIKSLNGYDATREKLDEGSTLNVKNQCNNQQNLKPKCWLVIKLNIFLLLLYK